MILNKGAKRVRNELDIVQFIKNQFQTTSLLQRVVKAKVRKQHQKEGKRIISTKNDLKIDSDFTVDDQEMEMKVSHRSEAYNINKSIQEDDNIGDKSEITGQVNNAASQRSGAPSRFVEVKLKQGTASNEVRVADHSVQLSD